MLNNFVYCKEMALKTFNLDAEVYKEFSKHCKANGISMSKRVENFIREELELIKGGKTRETKRGSSDSWHPMGRYC